MAIVEMTNMIADRPQSEEKTQSEKKVNHSYNINNITVFDREQVMKDSFISFPIKFLVPEYVKRNKLPKVFAAVYCLIDMRKNIIRDSNITPRHVLDFCGYKCNPAKKKIFYDVLDSLSIMEKHGMIKCHKNPQSVNNYDDLIDMAINSKKFYDKEMFVRVSFRQMDSIQNIRANIHKEMLLLSYLAIKSHICFRTKFQEIEKYPEATWVGYDTLSQETKLCTKTIQKCIGELIKPENKLLIRDEVKKDNIVFFNDCYFYASVEDNRDSNPFEEIAYAKMKYKEIMDFKINQYNEILKNKFN